MEWYLLALLSAFGQALAWALKKKSLDGEGLNNVLGFVSFLTAGMILFFFTTTTHNWPEVISVKFWWAILGVILLNIIGVWTAYRALDLSDFSRLMPFMAVSAVLTIPAEFLIRGTIPSTLQVLGILSVTVGAILFIGERRLNINSTKALLYFAVTLICYTLANPIMAIGVSESESGIFTATIAHLGIAIGFFPLIFFSGEYKKLVFSDSAKKLFALLFTMMATGLVMALLENGPATIALEKASASEVFGLKRTMPFFALILGLTIFHEKIFLRHYIGTVFLVVGSFVIIWFK